MSSIIVTLHIPGPRTPIDLELPDDVPLKKLFPALLSALRLPRTDIAGRPIPYHLTWQSRGRTLHVHKTLHEAGVVTGDILALISQVPPGIPVGRTGGGQIASLRTPSGIVILLENYGKTELTIGRYDARTGQHPDIDLSDEADGSTVSRAHALLRKQGNRWTLTPISVKNTTKLGNMSLTPHQAYPLQSGQIITLGAVSYIFEVR